MSASSFLIAVALVFFCRGFAHAQPCTEVDVFDGEVDDTAAIQRAVDRGHCVHIGAQKRELRVTHDIILSTAGQLIYGDGRFATRIRSGDPAGFKRGLFVAKTGEPGPILRDFGVFYDQPDTSSARELIKYPPAFVMDATPRFRMEHMGCYLATVCVEAMENSGGAILEDVQVTAFSIGIDIDDALDSVRLENIQWYPFYLTPKLQNLFTDYHLGHAVGIKLGRVDDFHVVDGLFLGGLGLAIGPSSKDGVVGFGSVRGCDFDGGFGMQILAVGSADIVGNEFTLGIPGATSLSMLNGIASIVGNKFLLSTQALPIEISGGMATIGGNNFAMGAIDTTLLEQRGAETQTVFNANTVASDGTHSHVWPLLDLRGGDIVASDNIVTPLQSGKTGVAVRVGRSARATRIDGNIAHGWQISRSQAL